MRPQKVLDIDLISALTKVFRSKGYEGASLKELSDATGLQKASLYHRFPKGKQEMAETVFQNVQAWVEANIFFVLTDKFNSRETRLTNGLSNIQKLYDGGKETCILRAFSMKTGLDLFEQIIAEGLNEWIDTFTKVGISFDLPQDISREKAIQTLIDIQGSLILTQGLDDINIFENTLKNIKNRYMKT